MSNEDDLVRESWGRDAQVSVQARQDFWGREIQEDQSTQARVCQAASEVFRFSNSYGGCCPEDSTVTCSFATACTSGVIRYIVGDNRTCGTGRECKTIRLVHPGQEAFPTMQFVCGDVVSFTLSSLWRQLPAETTTSEVTSTSSLPSSVTASETSPTTTTTDPLPSNTEGTEDGDGTGSNMAWIAGAVAGPLILIIAVALGIWWFRRRSAKKAAALQTEAQGQGYVPTMAPHPGWTPSPPYLQQPKASSPSDHQEAHGTPRWADNRYSMAEMPSSSPPPPQELPSSPQRP